MKKVDGLRRLSLVLAALGAAFGAAIGFFASAGKEVIVIAGAVLGLMAGRTAALIILRVIRHSSRTN